MKSRLNFGRSFESFVAGFMGFVACAIIAACAQTTVATGTFTPSRRPTSRPAGQFTEYAIPTAYGHPLAITSVSDGALWFLEDSFPPKIGRITTSGHITQYGLPDNTFLGGIAAGPDGALWFVALARPFPIIGRLTSAGNMRTYSMGARARYRRPSSIAAGPDGRMWFTCAGGGRTSSLDALIGNIATNGRIKLYSLAPNHDLESITSGPDGALWFVDHKTTASSYFGGIGQMMPTGQLREFGFNELPPLNPQAISSGPDGALWFTEPYDIGRLTTAGKITIYGITSPGLSLKGIAAGSDRALWFTNQAGNGYIGRITVDGQVDAFPTPTQDSQPTGIALGPDGAMWFTESAANKIGRITTSATP